VHRGFLLEYSSLRRCVRESLVERGCGVGSKIRSTGWSLGAAVSSLAMVELAGLGWDVVESYDFGKPRVGDTAFARTFNGLFGDVAWRVTHGRDPIPHLPPNEWVFRGRSMSWHFEHVRQEAFYPGDVDGGHTECAAPDDTACSARYPHLLPLLVHSADHFTYMGVRMGKSGCDAPWPARAWSALFT